MRVGHSISDAVMACQMSWTVQAHCRGAPAGIRQLALHHTPCVVEGVAVQGLHGRQIMWACLTS